MFRNHATISTIATEVSQNNRLEEDVHRLFHPFNFLMTLFCSRKFHIRHNHIVPNGRKFTAISIIVFSVMSVVHAYRVFKDLSEMISQRNEFVLTVFVMSLFHLCYASGYLITYVSNIIFNKDNIAFVLLFQTVHNSFDNGISIKSLIIWNWISIFIFLAYSIPHFFVIISYFLVIQSMYQIPENVLNVFNEILYIGLDINYVYTIRVLAMLIHYQQEWNKVITSSSRQRFYKLHYSKLFGTYQNIMKTFTVYKKVSQFFVSCFDDHQSFYAVEQQHDAAVNLQSLYTQPLPAAL